MPDAAGLSVGDYRIKVKEVLGAYDLKGADGSQLTAAALLVAYPQTKGKEERSIYHYHIPVWKDHQTIDPDLLANFVEKIYSHKSQLDTLIVHCSAGVGRTGAFLAIFELYSQYMRAEISQDQLPGLIEKMVTKLRQNRYGMVQQKAQYQLIYDTLKILIQKRV